MFIPFITRRSPAGGGGGGSSSGGGGSRGGSSSGGSSSSGRGGSSGSGSGSSGRGSSSGSSTGSGRGGSSSGSSSSGPRSVPLSGGGVAGRSSATAYGAGGGASTTIGKGQLFAGRQQGGGTRGQVYGTQTYGSGYPGISNSSSRGVAGLGFPFYFWPVVWGGAAVGGSAYLHEKEYGDANNSSRPGNALTSVAFTSNSGNTTLRLVADNSTTSSVASIVGTNCSSLIAGSQIVVAVGSSSNSSNISFTTLPEQAVQYYRASSIVLTLDGYNDTDAVQANLSTHVPIPNWVNQTMLQCVNQTIGAAAPLIDAGTSTATGLSLPNSAMSTTSISLEFGLQTGGMGLVCLTWIIGYMLSRVL